MKKNNCCSTQIRNIGKRGAVKGARGMPEKLLRIDKEKEPTGTDSKFSAIIFPFDGNDFFPIEYIQRTNTTFN